MQHEILLDARQLDSLIKADNVVVVDCRFDLGNPVQGEQDYLSGHIPGACYAHLDHDLASAMTPTSGRHPLPSEQQFAGFLSRIGWQPDRLLVAHDERNNAIAVRLWWLMKYFGLPAAVLDGGLEAWQRAGLSLETGPVEPRQTPLPELQPRPELTARVDEIHAGLDERQHLLVDARAAERFSGETEPLDARAGHIPGAINRFLGQNLTASGEFKSRQQLRAEFEQLLGGTDIASVVHSCGSGVTACHNAFAMELAGLGTARVYPGSWSEWSRDAARPVATGS